MNPWLYTLLRMGPLPMVILVGIFVTAVLLIRRCVSRSSSHCEGGFGLALWALPLLLGSFGALLSLSVARSEWVSQRSDERGVSIGIGFIYQAQLFLGTALTLWLICFVTYLLLVRARSNATSHATNNVAS
jgi:hypothetical protein